MSGWLETAGVVLLGVVGVFLGRWFGKLQRPYWVLGYVVPLLLVGLIGLARRVTALESVPPISWLMEGRREFAWTALLTPMLLTTPLSRVPSKRVRVLVWVFMVMVVVTTAVLPFLAPTLNRSYLAGLQTRIDADGVCLQSNDYTCGPAAAVTALHRLGLPAEEGELAILAHTSRFTGTEPDFLRAALQKRYAANGLTCDYRRFRSVEELRGPGVAMARMKFGLLVDHWVTVFEVAEDVVVIGDPLAGRQRVKREEFARNWRYCGLILRRDGR